MRAARASLRSLATASDDGTCQVTSVGCKEPTATNFDDTATTADLNLCIFAVRGCTDSRADNYNSVAGMKLPAEVAKKFKQILKKIKKYGGEPKFGRSS